MTSLADDEVTTVKFDNTIYRRILTASGEIKFEPINKYNFNPSISSFTEFGIKIKGIDIICINNDKPTYIQMKTMEGTLTGSQASRSEDELLIHKNSYFAAVFETGSSWTFNSDKIKKIKGNEFWSIINLDYDYILKEVKLMVKEIEDKFHELTKPKN